MRRAGCAANAKMITITFRSNRLYALFSVKNTAWWWFIMLRNAHRRFARVVWSVSSPLNDSRLTLGVRMSHEGFDLPKYSCSGDLFAASIASNDVT